MPEDIMVLRRADGQARRRVRAFKIYQVGYIRYQARYEYSHARLVLPALIEVKRSIMRLSRMNHTILKAPYISIPLVFNNEYHGIIVSRQY